MNNHSVKNIPASLKQNLIQLPEELAAEYEVLSCLKYSAQAATYLLKEKNSGKTVLLKTASDSPYVEALLNEKHILEVIHQYDSVAAHTFSYTLCLTEIENTHFYIRSFIEGKTLEELCESNLKKPGLHPDQALDYVIKLTELLHFLHTLNPPVIHRDIKPQNVVVDSNGLCHFIDLGISRLFGTDKKNDTLIMGTRITAPPEQFGYQQTDIRSDLYSLGILLHYCITGEYEIDDNTLREIAAPIQVIIRKATMFDPDKRYQTTAELLPDLLVVRYPCLLQSAALHPQHSKTAKALFVVLLLNLGLLIALLYQRFAPGSSPAALTETSDFTEAFDAEQQPYIFREPLIEDAVRIALNKPEGTITEKDLKKISELHIMGLQIFSDDSEIWFKGEYPWFYDDAARESGLYLQTGTIKTLEDITHMPNLVVLSLYDQQISDISLLRDTTIRELGLGYNPLTDLTPLEGNTSLRYLNVACLDISDNEVLATLPELRSLNISGTGIRTLKGLEKCHLEELNLFNQDLLHYEELRNLPYLSTLVLKYVNSSVLDSIAGLPLKDLSIHYSHTMNQDDLSVLPDLEKLFISGDQESVTTITFPNLPNLKSIDLVRTRIADFKGFASLSSLTDLAIYNLEYDSLDGLDQIPNLRNISCTTDQQKEINEMYPGNDFIFNF